MISNPKLRHEAQDAALKYKEAETALSNDTSLYNRTLSVGGAFMEAVRLKTESFGNMACVLTKIVYGDRWESDECRKVASDMSIFAVATGILDDLMDYEEDRERGHVTIATAGRRVDECLGQKAGLTAINYMKSLIYSTNSRELKEVAFKLFLSALGNEKTGDN